MFIRKKDEATASHIPPLQYEKQIVFIRGHQTRRLSTNYFGDGVNYIDPQTANNMRFFVDTDGIKFGDENLNRVIIPKEVFIEAVNKFCPGKIE